jgi:hypothetical protein
MRITLVTLIALTLATPAAAQMAYRYVFPDGRVVYSDQPVPGARGEHAIAPPPPAADPTLATDPQVMPPAAETASPAATSAAAPAVNPEPVASAPAPVANPEPAVARAVAASPSDAVRPMPAEPQAVPVAAISSELAAKAPPDRIALFVTADDEVRAAERNLAAVQAALEAGREPLPGERSGLARAGSRLNQSYWDRQRQLEDAVTVAQGRLDRAVVERNALR